jgi:hypothetical protein
VVIEVPTHHPLTWMNPLWKQFHEVQRPTTPTAGDLVDILSAMRCEDLLAEYWQLPEPGLAESDNTESDNRVSEARVALVTQRLCLPQERASEVAAALREVDDSRRDLVTISWTP